MFSTIGVKVLLGSLIIQKIPTENTLTVKLYLGECGETELARESDKV